jgi:putative membrane protein
MKGRRIIEPHTEMVFEWVGPLLVLATIALLVIGAVLITRTIVNSRAVGSTSAGVPSGPLRILEERFARGEIDEEEFRRRRDILRG